MTEVRCCTLSSLRDRFSAGNELVTTFRPWRIVYCRNEMDEAAVEAVARIISCETGIPVDTKAVPRSGWAGLLRNVPSSGYSDSCADPASHVVAVAKDVQRGVEPILVLVGLKYRGNVGSIVRAAVQADCFAEIHIIEERQEETGTLEGPGRRGGGSGRRRHNQNDNSKHSKATSPSSAPAELEQHAKLKEHATWTDADVAYFSLWNSPLVRILRFATVADFFRHIDGGSPFQNSSSSRLGGSDAMPDRSLSSPPRRSAQERAPRAMDGIRIVGVDGGTQVSGRPLNLYSREAMEALRYRGRQDSGDGGDGGDGGAAGGDDDSSLRGSRTSAHSGLEVPDSPRRNPIRVRMYVALGAEDQGLPAHFLRECDQLIMIPCLSASVNVASAFSSVLAVMQIGCAFFQGSTRKSQSECAMEGTSEVPTKPRRQRHTTSVCLIGAMAVLTLAMMRVMRQATSATLGKS